MNLLMLLIDILKLPFISKFDNSYYAVAGDGAQADALRILLPHFFLFVLLIVFLFRLFADRA